MGLVIESDLGNDADDNFALLFFLGLGVKIDAILLSPGDLAQVAIARGLVKQFNQTPLILTPASRISKPHTPNFHQWLLNELGEPLEAEPDGHEELLPKEPVEVFICGPVKQAHLLKPTRITVQGGFVPYSRYRPKRVLAKFEGLEACPTFNLGGTKPHISQALIEAPVAHRWVGKNICHSVLYTPEVHERYCPAVGPVALQLHKLAMEEYLRRKGAKAFHDPLAAVLHQNLYLGEWMMLRPERRNGKYTAVPDDGWVGAEPAHRSLVDLVDEPWKLYFDGLMGLQTPQTYG